MKNLDRNKAKEWFVSYLKMRLSGDGHVRNTINKGKAKDIITRRVALSRNISIKLDRNTLETIDKNYRHKKPLKEYPKHLVEILRLEAKRRRNYPKEFTDIKSLLLKFFDIKSEIYPYGLRCIYLDKKRNRYIVSAIYKLVISRKEDIIKFNGEINFADFDSMNRRKLLKLLNTYKK